MNTLKDKGVKMRIIRCSNCGIPTPYGTAHICDEYDYANYQLSTPLGKRIQNWFNSGMRSD